MKRDTRHPIRRWLDEHELSQAWLAAETGLSIPYVSMIIAGKRTPSLPVAVELHRVTSIPVDQFVAQG